jgi:hypothetical protein
MPNGQSDGNALTVRGWQRAGALIRLFTPPTQPHLATPMYIFAARDPHGSIRATQTVLPLAEYLALTIDTTYKVGEEEALLSCALAVADTALIVWQHNAIPRLASTLMPEEVLPRWPDVRFDLVWVFDRPADSAWTLIEVAQKLLSGDRR